MSSGMVGAVDLFKKKTGDPGEQAKEDPIEKAEREFFEIIKKVGGSQWSSAWSQEQELRLAAKKGQVEKTPELED